MMPDNTHGRKWDEKRRALLSPRSLTPEDQIRRLLWIVADLTAENQHLRADRDALQQRELYRKQAGQ